MRLRRRPLAAMAGVLIGAAGCGVDTTDAPSAGTPPPSATVSTIVGVDPNAPPADQTPPMGANGIQVLDGRLWIADLAGNQIIVADASDGTILARFGDAAGVGGGPDDLVMAPDGTVYWTAFDTGGVGHLTLDGRSRPVAVLPAGTNPIAWSPGGTLYVGVAVVGDGLYEIDPTGGDDAAPRRISEAVGNVNAFDVGPDGFIYGPSYADGAGTVVKIDPLDGTTTIVADLPGFPTAARFIDDHRIMVLTNLPAALYEVDLSTLPAADDPAPPPDPRAEVRPRGDVALEATDNFTIAPDGTIYVTAFDEPTVIAIAIDGSTTTIPIGDADG